MPTGDPTPPPQVLSSLKTSARDRKAVYEGTFTRHDQAAGVMGRHFNCAQGWSREGQLKRTLSLCCLPFSSGPLPASPCHDPKPPQTPRAALDLETGLGRSPVSARGNRRSAHLLSARSPWAPLTRSPSAGSKFARRGCARSRSTVSRYGASRSPMRPRRRVMLCPGALGSGAFKEGGNHLSLRSIRFAVIMLAGALARFGLGHLTGSACAHGLGPVSLGSARCRRLYALSGPLAGVLVQVATIVALIVLAFLLRRHGASGFPFTVAAAALFAMACWGGGYSSIR